MGDDVESEFLFVAAPGGWLEVDSAGGEPFGHEVVGEGGLGGADVVALADVVEGGDAVGLGFCNGSESALADLASGAVAGGDVGEPGVGVASFADVGFAGLSAGGHPVCPP